MAPASSSSVVAHHRGTAPFPSAADDVNGADAFDAIVQAANPAHPDHAAWKERYGGGSMRSMRKSIDGQQAVSQMAEGSVRRQRSKTNQRHPVNLTSPRSRPSLDGVGMRGRARSAANGNNGIDPTSEAHVATTYGHEQVASTPRASPTDLVSAQKGKGITSADELRPKRKKKRDKGKAKAGPPPVPPPRTTSHPAFHDSPATSHDGTLFATESSAQHHSTIQIDRRPSLSAPTSPNPALPYHNAMSRTQLSSTGGNEIATTMAQSLRPFKDDLRFNDATAVRQRGKSFDVSRADVSNGYSARAGTLPYRLSSKDGDLARNDAHLREANKIPGRRSIDFRIPDVPMVDTPPTSSKKGFESIIASLRNAASKNSTLRSDKHAEPLQRSEDANKSPLPPILRFVPGRASMSETRRDPPPPPPPRSPLRAQANSTLDNVREESREDSRDADVSIQSKLPDMPIQAFEPPTSSAQQLKKNTENAVPISTEAGAAAHDTKPERLSHSRSMSASVRSDVTDDFYDARSAVGEEPSHSRSVSIATASRDVEMNAKQLAEIGSTPGPQKRLPLLPTHNQGNEAARTRELDNFDRLPLGNTTSDLSTMSPRSYGGSSTHTRPILSTTEDDADRTPRFPFSDSGMSLAGHGLHPVQAGTSNGLASPVLSSPSQFHPANGAPPAPAPNRHNLVQQRSYSRLGIFSRLRRDRTPSQPHMRASDSGDIAASNENLAGQAKPFIPPSESNTSQWADRSTSSSSVTGLGIENATARNVSGQAIAIESPRRVSQDSGAGWRARLPSFSTGKALKSPPSAWHGVRASDSVPPIPRMPSDVSLTDPAAYGTALQPSMSRSTSDAMGSSASHGNLAPPIDSTTIHKTLSPALLTEDHHEADEVGSFIGSEDAEEAREKASKRGTWESFGSYELAPNKTVVAKTPADVLIAPDESVEQLPSEEVVVQHADPLLSTDQSTTTTPLSLTARRASRSSSGAKAVHTPTPLELNREPVLVIDDSAVEEVPERRRPSFTLRRSKSPMPFPAQSVEAHSAAESNGQAKRSRNHSLGSTLLPVINSPKPRSSFAGDRDRSPVLNQIWADLPPSPSPRSSAVRKFFSTGKASALRGTTRVGGGKGLSNTMLYASPPPPPPSQQPPSATPTKEQIASGQFEDSSFDRFTPPSTAMRKTFSPDSREVADRSTRAADIFSEQEKSSGLIPISTCENASIASSQPLSSADHQHGGGYADVRFVRSTGGSVGSSASTGIHGGLLQTTKDNSVGSIGTGTEGSISSMATTDAPPSSLHSISTRSISASVTPSTRVVVPNATNNVGRASTPTASIGAASSSSHTAHSNGGGGSANHSTDRDAFDRMLRARAKDDAARLREIAQRGGAPNNARAPPSPPSKAPPPPPASSSSIATPDSR